MSDKLWCLSHATLKVAMFGGAEVATALSATCSSLRRSVGSALGVGFCVWYSMLVERLQAAIKHTGTDSVRPRVHHPETPSSTMDVELEISDVRSTCASLFLMHEASVQKETEGRVVFRPATEAALGPRRGISCRLMHPLNLFFNTTSGATLALNGAAAGNPHSLLLNTGTGRRLIGGVNVRRLGAATAAGRPLSSPLLAVYARLQDCVRFFEAVAAAEPRVPRGLSCGGALRIGVKDAWGQHVCLFEIPGRSLAWRVAGVTRRNPTSLDNYNSFRKVQRVCCTNLRYLVHKGLAAFGRPPTTGLLLCCEPAPGVRRMQVYERVGPTDNLLQMPLVEAPLVLDVMMGARLLVLTRIDLQSSRPTRGACTLDDLLAARAAAPLLLRPPQELRSVRCCIDFLYERVFPGSAAPDTPAILAAAERPLEHGLRVQESTARAAPFLSGGGDDAAHPLSPAGLARARMLLLAIARGPGGAAACMEEALVCDRHCTFTGSTQFFWATDLLRSTGRTQMVRHLCFTRALSSATARTPWSPSGRAWRPCTRAFAPWRSGSGIPSPPSCWRAVGELFRRRTRAFRSTPCCGGCAPAGFWTYRSPSRRAAT